MMLEVGERFEVDHAEPNRFLKYSFKNNLLESGTVTLIRFWF